MFEERVWGFVIKKFVGALYILYNASLEAESRLWTGNPFLSDARHTKNTPSKDKVFLCIDKCLPRKAIDILIIIPYKISKTFIKPIAHR